MLGLIYGGTAYELVVYKARWAANPGGMFL
jgi:hypothetical protein